jgi:drug/metabolite transporter (DMT)-like permease
MVTMTVSEVEAYLMENTICQLMPVAMVFVKPDNAPILDLLDASKRTTINASQRSYLYALVAVLIWSTVATAFTMSLRVMGRVELLLWASLVSFVLFGLIILATHRIHATLAYLSRHWKRTLILGTLNPFVYYFTLFYAYTLLPAQEAQAINYTWALTLAYLSVPLLGHRLSRWDIMAGIICYMGVLVIATHGNILSWDFSHPFGVGIALLSTLFWALYWIMLARYDEDTVIVLFANFGVGLVWIIGYILLYNIPITPTMTTGHWGAIYIGLFEMGMTFLLWGRAMSLTDNTSHISNLIFLSPILSLFFIHSIAEEPILFTTIIALGLILSGLALQQYKR